MEKMEQIGTPIEIKDLTLSDVTAALNPLNLIVKTRLGSGTFEVVYKATDKTTKQGRGG